MKIKKRVTTKKVRETVNLLEKIIKEYKKETLDKEKDWRTKEERIHQRLRTAFTELKSLIEKAVSSIKIVKGETRGSPQSLTLEQKTLLLLLKHLISKSNRSMSHMLTLFLWLTNINISYKTIERLYSDHEVRVVLYNLHILMLKKKGITNSDSCGDGTGYALTIKKHYATEAQKLKDKIKKIDKRRKKKEFFFSFAVMDIQSRMYIGFGTSFKSEQEAHSNALELCKETGVKLNSMRLDRLFSGKSCIDLYQREFGKVKMYIIPKKNVTVGGSYEWDRMLYRFVHDTEGFLKEYFQRNQSESGIAEDKKRTGWKVGQKRHDRIETANNLTHLWHNLYWLG
jgi:transposase